jgi:adenylate kinase
MDRGQLVRDEVVDALIKSKLRRRGYRTNILFDGFPRTEYQAEFLDELLNELGRTLDAVIYLDISNDEVKKRLPGRIICQQCHTPYHELYNPFTVCYNCGSNQSYRRDDDRPEIVAARLRIFYRQVAPLIDYYSKSGRLVVVNGEDGIDQVTARLTEVMEAIQRWNIRPATHEEIARIEAHRDASLILSPEEANDSLSIVLLGSPGSGKGTQAEKISKLLEVAHVSTGEIFRNHIKNNTKLGKLAKSFLDRGELVPDDVTEGMVRERLQQDDVQTGFILDGFPRNIAQAEALTDIMTGMRRRLSGVLYINVSDDEIVKRLSGRVICNKCQTPYHIEYHPPLKEGFCDSCGGNLYRREDDDPETVRARLRTYYGQTAPLIHYYRTMKLLFEISGEGQVSDVSGRIMSAMQSIRLKEKV